MKTPQQTAEYLQQKDDKAAIKALKVQEKHLQQIRKELTDILDNAIKEGNVTPQGGRIEYYNFYRIRNCDKINREKGLANIIDIFREAGWDCQYRPYTESCYSMTCESSSDVTTHYFQLLPLAEAAKQRKEEEKRKQGYHRMSLPFPGVSRISKDI